MWFSLVKMELWKRKGMSVGHAHSLSAQQPAAGKLFTSQGLSPRIGNLFRRASKERLAGGMRRLRGAIAIRMQKLGQRFLDRPQALFQRDLRPPVQGRRQRRLDD